MARADAKREGAAVSAGAIGGAILGCVLGRGVGHGRLRRGRWALAHDASDRRIRVAVYGQLHLEEPAEQGFCASVGLVGRASLGCILGRGDGHGCLRRRR